MEKSLFYENVRRAEREKKVTLIYGDVATAPPGYNPSFDYGHQQYSTDSQRTFRSDRNDESQQSVNNVYIQIFLIKPNRTAINPNVPINDLRENNTSLLGSHQNPISLSIDLEKGTIDEVSNRRYLSSRINSEQAATFISDGLYAKTEMTQNPLRSFYSLLHDDLSFDSNENSKNYANNLQSTSTHSITPTAKIIREDFSSLAREESKNLAKTLTEEIEPSALFKSNIGTLAVVDGNTSGFRGTSEEAILFSKRNFEEAEKKIFSTSTHPSNWNLNSPMRRNGNLASSHIVDYSAFLASSPSAETSTAIPHFEIIPAATTTISTDENEMLLKQTSAMTTSQQSSAATINFGPKTSGEDNYSSKIGTSSIQTSEASQITENETDFRKIVQTSVTDRSTISNNILPFEPLLTSTIASTPELIIFPTRKNFDIAHVGIKISPVFDESSKSSEEKMVMLSLTEPSIENITEPKNNSGNGALLLEREFPATSIVIGDREILDEQKSPTSVQAMRPHISVGERISGFQETHSSDSSEDEATTITKSSSSSQSAEVAQVTQFRKPLQSGLNSRDDIILPDAISREDEITPPDVFFISEHDFAISEPYSKKSIDSSVSNGDTLFTESEAEQEKSEVLKSEFKTSTSTELLPVIEHTEFTQSQLLSNLTRLEATNDEANISGSNVDSKIKPDFRPSQLKLVRLIRMSHSFECPSVARSTSDVKVDGLIDCDIIAANEDMVADECPISNDKSDQTRSDILFLIDASHNISQIRFQQTVKLIMDTVEQFNNIGPDGVQISLVQFTRESVLEFSFHKHNCKPCLLADIGDTEYISGMSSTDNAIQNIIKYGFSKQRGDRNDVANVLVVVNSEMSHDQFQEALQLLHPNNVTMVVVSTDGTNPQLNKQFIKDDIRHSLLFSSTAADSDQISGHLAECIRTIAKEKSTSSEKITAVEMDESVQEFTAQCLTDGFNATFKFLKSFGGIIAVRSRNATKNCSIVIQAEQFGEHIDTREVHFFIGFKECEVEETVSVNPSGMNYSALINVIHDKWLVSGADEGFVVQCHQPKQSQSQEGNMRIDPIPQSDNKMAEILPLNSIPPSCNYSIRANAPNGPPVQFAKFGDVVYHKWECEDDPQRSDLYGLYIRDCYAESETKEQHIIVDSDGCSADANIVNSVIYADNKLMAFARVKVFRLFDSDHLSFHCKLTLCVRKADGCEGVTPPRCLRTGRKNLLANRRNRHSTESFLATLTVQDEVGLTVVLPVNVTDSAFSLQTVKELSNTNLLWLIAILILLSISVLLMLVRYITKMNGKNEFIASESFKRHEIIDDIDYITSATSASANTDGLSSSKKDMEKRKDVCRSTSLKEISSENDKDRKVRIEVVSVSLNSVYDEIKRTSKYDSLTATIPITKSLYVHRDGSSWSF
uniref:ZP domain-containing protein n=1 Tax=Elaeophora elaphi TaxID=1147741 RepID=A0A0R3RI54_9BILA